MAGRVVLFGATGYTGRLTAEAMTARGLRPVLAARTRSKLDAMAGDLGGLETAVADVSEPVTVSALVEEGDVLVSTVGPFVRWGSAAAAAATSTGAHYLDSTGEPPFIREVFERYAPAAEKAGSAMFTAFGYDWVPGNLAGGLALDRAGDAATRVDVGYFLTGRGDTSSMSGGTKASMVGVIAAPSFHFVDGAVRTERGAQALRTFPIAARQRPAVSVGSSEHFTLPRSAPGLREVNAYLGWFGPASRAMQAVSGGMSLAMKVPGASELWNSVGDRLVQGSTGGPDENTRAKSGSHIVAIAYDRSANPLSEVHLVGVDGYTFTGRILAWGAEQVAAGAVKGTGALGPVDGFGLDVLTAGVAEAGISEEGTKA